MWLTAIRTAITWLFGEDILKYAVWFVAGLIAFTVMEASSFQTVMQTTPWGLWWGATGPSAPPVIAPPAIVPIPTLAPLPIEPLPSNERVTAWLTSAYTWLGVRYLFGGCTRAGIDCSCFVVNTLRTVGINAPRTTTQQIRWTRPVSRVELQRGDLLYFDNTCTDCGSNPTHVGIYIGDGQMIQAGGAAVSIQPVFTGWYSAHYSSAGRVPGL